MSIRVMNLLACSHKSVRGAVDSDATEHMDVMRAVEGVVASRSQ
jgi:hypothetical protein